MIPQALTAAMLVTLMAMPHWARADFRAHNGMAVRPDASRAGVFEVFPRVGAAPVDFWCAAGDYALRRLGLDAGNRLWVLRGPGPSVTRPGYRAVAFTTVPYPEVEAGAEALDPQDFALKVAEIGASQTAHHGQALCADSQRRFRRLGLNL